MFANGSSFALRLNPIQHLLRHGKIELALYLPFGALMVWAGGYLVGVDNPTLHSDRYGDPPTPLIAWGCLALGLSLLVGGPALIAMQARNGAALAADRDGVWWIRRVGSADRAEQALEAAPDQHHRTDWRGG